MKVGRNEPCPCGSGVKYKKCCLRRDQERAAAEAGASAETGAAAGGIGREPGAAEAGAAVGGTGREPGAAEASSAYASSAKRGGSGAATGDGGEHAGTGHAVTPKGLGGIPPYAVARIIEDTLGGRGGIELSKKQKKAFRNRWTISKVASMTTEAIEDKLRQYGVPYTREGLAELAEGRESAWSIMEPWLETARIGRGDTDADFLGLAACELWKRLLPERPSVEMIDDWMQEGYELDETGQLVEATQIWWKVWQVLRSRLSPSMRTMNATEKVFCGSQVMFNWCQDFELCLCNVVIDNPELAGFGKQYCMEWLEQFPDEDGRMQVSVLRSLARFQFYLGETSAGEETLHGIVERWPQDVWGYVALGDAYAHFPGQKRRQPGPEPDLERAMGYLEKGLAVVTGDEDRRVLLERLQELKQSGEEQAGL